jgi:hypothetical protein
MRSIWRKTGLTISPSSFRTLQPLPDAGGRGGRGGRGFGGAPGEVVFGPGGGGPGGFGRGGRGGGQTFGATADAPGVTAAPSADPNADPLFQLAWTRPTGDGSPANTAGQNLYGEAIDLARKADAVVLVVGIDGSQEGEGHDRAPLNSRRCRRV